MSAMTAMTAEPGWTGTAPARPAPAARSGRLHVVLTSEGTYPHFKGGVSTWCHTLIRQMPEIDFTLWALMMNPHVAEQYQLPPNVVDFIGVPMWGIEEPAEYTPSIPALRLVSLSRSTTEARVVEGFPTLLESLLREIGSPAFDPYRFARLLQQMHAWFEVNDYRATFRSRSTWEISKAVLLESNGVTNGGPGDEAVQARLSEDDMRLSPERGPTLDEARDRFGDLRHVKRPPEGSIESDTHLPTLNDATEGLRWLYRLLMPLNTPIVRADLFHSSAAAFCGIPAILSKLEHGTPFLLTEHGVYMREQYLAIGRAGYPYHLKKFVIQMVAAVSRTCFALADQVSPVCHYNSRWELRNGVEPSRLRVIYNGVDPSVYMPRPARRPAAPTVVTLARIDPLKDLETFLGVADVVRRRVPNVQFLHWGPAVDAGYERKIVDLRKRLRLEGVVHFMGVTEDPAGAINKGDVVVLTSISEAFPYTVVESLMCGKPVVATDVGGVREAIDGAGILARPGDVTGIADGLVHYLALDPEARAELAGRCRDRALRFFTVGAAVDAYRGSYIRLADQARRPIVEVPGRTPAETVPAGIVEAVEPSPSFGVQVPSQAPAGEAAAWSTAPETAAASPAEAVAVVTPETAAALLPATGANGTDQAIVTTTAELSAAPAPEEVAVTVPETAAAFTVPVAEPEGVPGAIDLSQRLAHPDPAVRRTAVLEVPVAQGPGSIATLGEILARDPDVDVRAAALAAMASMVAREVI